MAENSGIAWTTHTFNPWVGCTKVSPGCDHCYAEAWDKRAGGPSHWGPGAPRRRTTMQNWNKPLRWQKERRAALDRGERPEPVRVFCASLADVFDNQVPNEWRDDLWRLIAQCPDLCWILVTKRVGNVARMMPIDWFPANMILLSTIVDQAEADRDLPKLRFLKQQDVVRYIGVSYEPALGPVDWSAHLSGARDALDWIIVGGESSQSGSLARDFPVNWAYRAIEAAAGTRCAVFVKQLGSSPKGLSPLDRVLLRDRAGADPNEWPADLRVRQFPVMGGRAIG